MVNLSDYFNSNTNRGRANVAKATYASIALIYVYSRFRRKKTAPKNTVEEVDVAPHKGPEIMQPPAQNIPSSPSCPKCQCECQCQPVTEAAASCGTCEGKNSKIHETHPASYLHTTQTPESSSSINKGTTKQPREPASNVLNDSELHEALNYRKGKSFTDWGDPW